MIEIALTGKLFKPAVEKVVGTGEDAKTTLQFALLVDAGGDDGTWFSITAWPPLAQELAGKLTERRSVYVEGALRLNRYEKDGQERLAYNISARTVLPLGDNTRRGTPPPSQKREQRGTTQWSRDAGTTDRRGYDRGVVFE